MRPKWRFLRFWAKKCENGRFGALLRPKTHFFAFCAPKRKKRAWARNVALANAFLGILDAIFAKRRKRADFKHFGRFLPLLEAQNCFCSLKVKKRKNGRKTKKHHFRSERQTVKNISIWARFWGPKRPKALFPLLGQLFRSGAFLAPKARQNWK